MKNFIVFYYSLNSHFVVLNSFQDLKAPHQVRRDVGGGCRNEFGI